MQFFLRGAAAPARNQADKLEHVGFHIARAILANQFCVNGRIARKGRQLFCLVLKQRIVGPGPFQLSAPAFQQRLLEGAGFTAIDRQLLERPILVGGPGAKPAAAAAFALGAFSVGELAAAAGPDVLAAVTADLESLYAGLATDAGVPMDAAVWLISAEKV